MLKLTESMKSLNDAIKQQQKQLAKLIKKEEVQDIQLEPLREFSEIKKMSDIEHERFVSKLEPFLHSVGSDISQTSHWSCSLDTINSSIDDLKHVLKHNDKQLITLTTENEDLKIELKKKEKELKKQKFLLKAERETFEQYKKDTLGGPKKQSSPDEIEDIADKSSKELVKVKAELAHFRQIYIEQRHTMSRLSKIISTLKEDKIKLKDKLFQQEKQYSKFIMEMAQRFNISRKEFNLVTSKRFESLPITSTNFAVCKIADRNARLAYDNCMLKLELNELREKFFQKKAEDNKLKCLTTISGNSFENKYKKDSVNNKQDKDVKKVCPLKASASEKSGLSGTTNLNLKCAVKTSVTSLIERNSENTLAWQHSGEADALYRNDYDISGVDSFEVMRTESAPQLQVNKDQQ